MEKYEYVVIIMIALIASTGFLTYGEIVNNGNKQIIKPESLYPSNTKILGSNDRGIVIKSGPYGNNNSKTKIAVIVGVHPLELNSHKAMVTSINSLSNSLNNSYYIYSIYVTNDRDSYNKGRMNGQLLAKYAVDDIKKNNFDLAVDTHSNRGVYKEKRFICVPVKDDRSVAMAFDIDNKIPWLVYYLPPKEKGPSSPNYVTVPLIRNGTPAVVYETYMYEPYDLTVKHASEFITTIDKLKL